MKFIATILLFLVLMGNMGSVSVNAAEFEAPDLLPPEAYEVDLELGVDNIVGPLLPLVGGGAQIPFPDISVNFGLSDDPAALVPGLQLFFLITLITLAPTLILMVTSFTRLIVVLHFMRAAMGTQQMPPSQVLIGLALFLTLYMMGPIFGEIIDEAIVPYTNGQITQQEAIDRGWEPLHNFMLRQVHVTDLGLFMELADIDDVDPEGTEIPARVLIPAFILSELTTGFVIGFLLYLPFIVIDMVVASVLMAMGMMMLPPAMISLPFKILLFILTGGWTFVLGNVLLTFN